jgi:type I restriction enzyme S subunit
MGSNWPTVKLKELLEQNTTTEKLEPEESYRLLGVRLEGKGPFIREEKQGSQVRAKSLRKVTSGEFIYSRLFAWRGAFGLIPLEMDCAFVSNEFPTFKIDETRVFPKFLEMYFKQRWVWNEVEKYCTGTTKASRNRFKEKFFLNLEIPLPHIEEQKRIVARIESMMARIEETRRLRNETLGEAKELLSSQLEKIFSDKSKMQVTKKVEEICTNPQYGYTDSAKYEPIGPNFLRITDIQNGKVNWEQVPYSSCPRKEKYLLQSGDILFARSGATTGKSFLVKFPPESIFASYLIRIRPKKGILPDYLYWFFQSPTYWSQVIEKTKGSAQPNMNGKKLSNVQVPLPDNEETQRRIIAHLDSLQAKVDELKRLQAETEKELEELVPSILDKAFKGEL